MAFQEPINPGSQEVGRERGREGREIRGFRGGKDEESTDVSCKAIWDTPAGRENSRTLYTFGERLSSEGSGVQTRAEEYMLGLVPPRACISPHYTRVTFKTYRTSFARPCKWKDNTKTIAIKWWAMTFMKQSVKPLHRQVNSI